MKAVQLFETHQPLQYAEVPTPVAGPGKVLVKLRAAAINHRDVFIQQGLYPGIKLPVILGSDGAGVVAEVGVGVDSAWQGRAVIINPALHWGNNPNVYGPDFQILGMPTNGTYAEYIAVDAQYLYPQPAHLSYEQAAALPLAGLTAWRALMTRAGLQESASKKVLITGIGGGAALYALQFSVAVGAEVWVTSGSDEKIDRAKKLGAAGGVNYRQPDWYKTLLVQTGGERSGYFDSIIDSAGGPGFSRLTDLAAPGGRIVIFGGTTGNLTDIVPSKLFFKQLTILGTTMGTPDEFANMLTFVSKKQLTPIVDEVFPLAKAELAFDKMKQGQQFGKLVLTQEE